MMVGQRREGAGRSPARTCRAKLVTNIRSLLTCQSVNGDGWRESGLRFCLG